MHSLQAFGEAVGLNEFFIAVVIVAIVGNAAEHGGAIVIAKRGNTQLATEIAITSSMQVALFVAPVAALVSLLLSHHLSLAFRPVEIATMALGGRLGLARHQGRHVEALGGLPARRRLPRRRCRLRALVGGHDDVRHR